MQRNSIKTSTDLRELIRKPKGKKKEKVKKARHKRRSGRMRIRKK